MTRTKISTRDIKKIAKQYEGEEKVVELKKSDTETVEITIYPTISYDDYAQMVTDIINGMFDANGEYVPFARQASFDINLVKYYTNLKVENVRTIYNFIQNTDFLSIVYDTIGMDCEIKIWSDVNEGVEYRKQKIYHRSKWDSLADTLNDFLDGLVADIESNKDKFKDFDGKQLTELANKLVKNSDNIAVNAVMNKLDEKEETSDKIIDIEDKIK